MAQRIMLSISEALKLKNIGSWCCQKVVKEFRNAKKVQYIKVMSLLEIIN
ncbi:hypothetical protein PMEGAPL103_44770 [Priestia megaterium]